MTVNGTRKPTAVVDRQSGKAQRNRMIGAYSRTSGKQFESRLDAAFMAYTIAGIAAVEKTPEPMRPLSSLGNGRFVACFEKKAQPDYKGTLSGGRTIVFEAKYTAADRMAQSRVTDAQAAYMDRYADLGAQCYVVAGFASGGVYRVPWAIWRDMKDQFGRKYVTEADLEQYRVQVTAKGTLQLI